VAKKSVLKIAKNNAVYIIGLLVLIIGSIVFLVRRRKERKV